MTDINHTSNGLRTEHKRDLGSYDLDRSLHSFFSLETMPSTLCSRCTVELVERSTVTSEPEAAFGAKSLITYRN